MKLKLQFMQEDFADFKSFESAIKRQLGDDVHVGTDSLALYFRYPPAMVNMLRPYPEQFSFEIESKRT